MTPMAPRTLPILALLWALSPAAAQNDAGLKQQGQGLLATHCARCHAIASTGDSPHRQAPPLRTIGQKYPVEWFGEAPGEGLSTGHPDMPEFVFKPQEINAILTYLQSIQIPKPLQRR